MYHSFKTISLSNLPKISDHQQCETHLERWYVAIDRIDLEFGNIKAWMENENFAQLVKGIFGNSPYLSNLMIRDVAFALELFSKGPDACFDKILDRLAKMERFPADASPRSEAEVMKELRIAKRHAALLIAVADISELWDLTQITDAISDIAEYSLRATTAHILFQMHNRQELVLPYPETPNRESGFFILGMGKLGSRELNYSSDVDLIVLYDLNVITSKDHGRLRQGFVRATRDLMKIMDSRTADGYVFRTDLRLRPDPSATPLAMSYMAAVTYYESLGQNWERAAMIKARPVAGDLALAQNFLDDIKPFVWRKSLDFAMIEDIHAIKRQIHTHKGSGEIAVLNHNIKIGRGGIREIEFYAQTQQLIWGGRQVEMRVKDTREALQALTNFDHIQDHIRADLSDVYIFLRKLEHRLQMINDTQTQTLPDSEEAILHLAQFMGYGDSETFKSDLLNKLTIVQGHYARLFEEHHHSEVEDLPLNFGGAEITPETIKTLDTLGFTQPERTWTLIRTWNSGRYRATRTARSRQILDEILPTILEAFSKTADPDEAFIRFDTFLEGLPAGVQIFSLFQMNPELLSLVAEIMGEVPKSATWLASRPNLLDSVLSPHFFEPVGDRAEMKDQLTHALKEARDYQDVLDLTRRWTNDYKFRISIHIMRHLNNGEGLQEALTNVAEVALGCLIPHVVEDFAQAHGGFPDGNFAVLGFGKLGGKELMPGSDLDLVYIYEPGEVTQSDGERPLSPAMYYMRLCQRINTAINAQSGEGRLYEVDNRLRPNGNAGPVATQMASFEKYYRISGEDKTSDAWTWEHMALSRARVVFATADYDQQLTQSMNRHICQARNDKTLREDIAQMRQRIAQQFPGKERWDIKYIKGGLVDIEFIGQYLQLRHAHEHPEILSCNSKQGLLNCHKAELIEEAELNTLIEGLNLWHKLQSILRLTGVGDDKSDKAVVNRERLLRHASGIENFETLCAHIDETAMKCRDIFLSYFPDAKAEN